METPKFTVTSILGEPDFVTAYRDMKDKNGKSVPYFYCDIYKFLGGKIIELKSFLS